MRSAPILIFCTHRRAKAAEIGVARAEQFIKSPIFILTCNFFYTTIAERVTRII